MRYDIILIGLTLAIGIFSFFIAAFTLGNLRKAHGLWQIALMFFLEGVYAFAYGLELASTTLELKITFNHIQYLAIPYLAPIWLFIALKFRRHESRSPWWQTLAALATPTLIVLAVQVTTFSETCWYYTNWIVTPGTQATLGLDVLVLTKGPLYYLHSIHNLIVLFFVGYIYVTIAIRNPGVKRRQAITLAAFGFVAMTAIATTLFASTTSGIDFVLYAIAIISYFVLYSMFRFELFVLTPSAHQATFEKSLDPIVVLDVHYEIVSWNAAVGEFGNDVFKYHMPLDESFLPTEIIESIRDGQTVPFEHHGKRYIAETFPLYAKRGTPNGFLIRFNDMTSYLERVEKLDFEASHDALTNIYNRRAFNEMAGAYLLENTASREDFAVMMIDIDDFKIVNDTHGHAAGDIVLEELSRRTERQLDPRSVFARYGGEEFVVLVKSRRPEDVRQIAEQIRIAVESQPFAIGDTSVRITVSIGVKGGKTGTGSIREIVKGADEAMYISKRSQKNVVTTVL